MIIVDTNVVSEPMKASGAPQVQAWLDRQVPETLYLTSISLTELLLGIESLPTGKRKAGLSDALSALLEQLFESRVLAFDADAALHSARQLAQARKRGHSISLADSQIAAIAKAKGFMVATRDTAPFEALGVRVINPWLEQK